MTNVVAILDPAKQRRHLDMRATDSQPREHNTHLAPVLNIVPKIQHRTVPDVLRKPKGVRSMKEILNMNKKAYDFREALDKSNTHADDSAWESAYRRMFSDYDSSHYFKNNSAYQKRGIDRIVYLKRGKEVLIDEKYDDFKNDRMFLEVWSDVDRKALGWWADNTKECDYIAYMKTANSNAVHLFPYLDLQRLWDRWGESIIEHYGIKRVSNRDKKSGGEWTTEGIAVPISDVYEMLLADMQGA